MGTCPGRSIMVCTSRRQATWVWDAYEPNEPLNVDVYDGTILIATVLAGNFRQDLLNAGAGNGDHGFIIPTPAALKTGTAHTVTLKMGGTSTVVVGSPLTLTCSSPSFAGYFDSADCTQLAGWAWDANQPNAPLNVDIYDNGTLLAAIPAANFRQDLDNAGKGNGDHGFLDSSTLRSPFTPAPPIPCPSTLPAPTSQHPAGRDAAHHHLPDRADLDPFLSGRHAVWRHQLLLLLR
jgi:hypothetical protein